MRVKYDPEANAAYIRFLEGKFECTTVRLSEDVSVNMAPGGRVVGIEILDASANLEILPSTPRIQLENLAVGQG